MKKKIISGTSLDQAKVFFITQEMKVKPAVRNALAMEFDKVFQEGMDYQRAVTQLRATVADLMKKEPDDIEDDEETILAGKSPLG